MAGVCKWCGAFFKDITELEKHEDIHRQSDSLGGLINVNTQREDTCTESLPETENPQVIIKSKKQKATAGFPCDRCHKSYRRKNHLNTHFRAEHMGKTFSCSKCGKEFKYSFDKTHHQKSCQGVTEHLCLKCGKRCSTAHGLKRHKQWHDQELKSKSKTKPTTRTKQGNPSQQFQCRQCVEAFESRRRLQEHVLRQHRRSPGAVMERPRNSAPLQCQCRRCFQRFDSRRELYLHNMRQHYQVGGALQRRPWDNNNAPWERDGWNADLREVYEANAPLILESHRRGPIMSVYNFPLDNDVSMDQLMGFANEIYRQEQQAFRLNLVFGVILQNRVTGEYRYFVPYNNNGIFERPLYISRLRDLDNLRLNLQRRDILTDILRIRPDTQWIPVLVTNVHFTVYNTFYPLGTGDLPDYLLKKESIYPLIKNRQNGKLYEDHLCAFRCLALHRGYEIKSVDGPAKTFHHEWVKHPHSSTEGLTFEDFPAFETLFRVNLEVYSLQEDEIAVPVYKSRGVQDSTMYLNMYENHLSYIRDFNLYAQKYRCRTCERHFKHIRDLHRHQKICTNKTKYIYPGGFYKSRDSIFEELEQFGINVPKDQRTYPWILCYDFEAMLQKVNERPTEYLQWTQKHVPISVSICSNVEGHTEPMCIVEPDQDLLVQKMIEAMQHVANTVYQLAEEKWGWVLDAIDEKVNQDLEAEEQEEQEAEEGQEQDEEEEQDGEDNKRPLHPLKTLYGYLVGYISQLPVVGFNSAKYDLNLVRQYIAKHLNMHESIHSFVIKKNNAYSCIATDDLKFLDMSQFLAAGSSYAAFLKAYHVEEKKGFFPYEWFDQSKSSNGQLCPVTMLSSAV
ncbi:uncharacterized protein LOC128554633 [Mercenaria mercenaria]|uniref:uncharacterized protein LOC128554633 n=1 Tax=Mercenaria mercenaria TaxID=6596 RepID=UPI00234F5513|nr:uncharacterized protein LOC128554633 [Mercenaria mercenaria]XP_053391894.1 uncharacterized protein LOC128554633 [Mercenaria mercenaria]